MPHDRALNMDSSQLTIDAERFIETIAHELTNALHYIRVNARHGAEHSEHASRALSVIERVAEQGCYRLDSLRIVARPTIMDCRRRQRPRDIDRLIRDVIHAHAEHARERRIRIDYVPHDGGDRSYTIDPDRIQLAIWSILDNAIKYSNPDTNVHVSVTIDEYKTVVSVSNSGLSIQPSQIQSCFELGWRGDNARHVSGGLGIGLWVSRKIAHAHQGDIRLESTPQNTVCTLHFANQSTRNM